MLFLHILGINIPTDFHIFQRGWNMLKPPTRWWVSATLPKWPNKISACSPWNFSRWQWNPRISGDFPPWHRSDHNGLKALLAEMVAKNPPRCPKNPSDTWELMGENIEVPSWLPHVLAMLGICTSLWDHLEGWTSNGFQFGKVGNLAQALVHENK